MPKVKLKKKFVKQLQDRIKIEVDYDAPDWHGQMFLRSLQDIWDDVQKGVNPNQLLLRFIRSTETFIENVAAEDNSPLFSEIHQEFQMLTAFLPLVTIQSKIKTDQRAMAIGQFVEGLIYYGMPRLPAIKATKEWLSLGEATVRTYNEDYRKRYDDFLKNKNKNFEAHIGGPHNEIIRVFLKDLPDFPSYHPKAKKAFMKLKSAYERPNLYERLAQIQENLKAKSSE